VNRRLPVFLGALVFATSLGAMSSNEAEAGRGRGGARFSGGGFRGSVRASGGIRVTPRASSWRGSWSFARPAWRPNRWSVGGSIYVGPRFYPRPYYSYYPAYVPSYYQTESYYPVAPVAAPGLVATALVRPPLPKFGIGLFAGGSQVEAQDGGSLHDSDDVGVMGRIRLTPGLLLEGELGKTSYDEGSFDNVRVDRRLGASLIYEIGAYNRWAPYVVGGLGVQQVEVADQFETTQNFAEVGLGLRWAISRQFHLAADIRAGSRATVSESNSGDTVTSTPPGTSARIITPPSETSNESEEYTRGRLSAILYF
jgi:opacity protein-like surface antigen